LAKLPRTAGKLLVAYRHGDEIPLAEFLPDERFLVTVSYDGTLRVWATATGEPVVPPVPPGGKGLTLDVTGGGRFALASGFSKYVTVADLDPAGAGVTVEHGPERTRSAQGAPPPAT
jgi:WD40 repeat protein